MPYPSTLILAQIPGSVLASAVRLSRAPWHGAESPRAGAPKGSTSLALHFDDLMKTLSSKTKNSLWKAFERAF